MVGWQNCLNKLVWGGFDLATRLTHSRKGNRESIYLVDVASHHELYPQFYSEVGWLNLINEVLNKDSYFSWFAEWNYRILWFGYQPHDHDLCPQPYNVLSRQNFIIRAANKWPRFSYRWPIQRKELEKPSVWFGSPHLQYLRSVLLCSHLTEFADKQDPKWLWLGYSVELVVRWKT